MKKKIIFVTMVLFLTTNISFAQQEKNVIYVNILPVLLNNLNVHYERVVSDKMSLLVGLGYASGIFGITIEDFDIYTTALKLGIGFYPAGKTLRGFYLLPNIIMVTTNVKYKPTSETATARQTTMSVELGHRWIWSGGVFFDLSIGMGMSSEGVVETKDKKETIPGRVGLTHVGVQIGYAW